MPGFSRFTGKEANSMSTSETTSRGSLLSPPNVRAKRAATAGRQARAGENVPRPASRGLVACRWRSA